MMLRPKRVSKFILDEFGSEYRMTTDGVHAIFVHDDCGDHHGRLYVNVLNGGYFCHRCEFAGYVDINGFRPKAIKQESLRPLSYYEPRPLDEQAIAYLRKRNLGPLERDEYGLCISDTVRYEGLILFPVHDHLGNYAGWQGRIYKPLEEIPTYPIFDPWQRPIVHAVSNPKWFASKAFSRRAIVFNLNRWLPGSDLIVVEAIISCILVGKGGVCTFGKAVTARQIELIRDHRPRRVFVALDGDERVRNWKVARQFADAGLDTWVVTLPADPAFNDPASDPDWAYTLASAEPFDYLRCSREVHMAGIRPGPSSVRIPS